MHKQSTSKKHGNKKWRTEDNPRERFKRTPQEPPRHPQELQDPPKALSRPFGNPCVLNLLCFLARVSQTMWGEKVVQPTCPKLAPPPGSKPRPPSTPPKISQDPQTSPQNSPRAPPRPPVGVSYASCVLFWFWPMQE